MPLIAYIDRAFNARSLATIDAANEIIATYQAQGYTLTLRQLYYQFVSRDLITNTIRSYKRLGSIINGARLAGLIDWTAIEDRTRNLHSPATWDTPANIVAAAASQFKLDLWEDQENRIEVWIEKEALAGVFERVCDELRVPFFSCRGYTSQSEMWSAGQRIRAMYDANHPPIILHFGDHDPSGIDMSRDVEDRLKMFSGLDLRIQRLALTMEQVERYSPPPNPAKETDSRFRNYRRLYGGRSWELDALAPNVLAGLVEAAINGVRDQARWNVASAREDEHRRVLGLVSEGWERVVALVAGGADA